jgi:erythronate-4-phosphate dehydrogenase
MLQHVWENEPTIDTTLLPLITLGTPHIADYSLEGKINGTTMIRTAVCKHLGIDPSWDPLQHIPKPAVTTVHVPDNLNSVEEVLSYVVRQCYDIVYDNETLQRMISAPTNEQGIYFRGLRSGYHVRREFSNVIVRLTMHYSQHQDIIAMLGFSFDVVE